MTALNLGSIMKGVHPVPARVLTYGVDGVGKSTFWSQAPAPIFVPTEDGATRIAVDKFPLCTTWESVLDCLRVLCREQHSYKTVVIDSADWAQELMVRHILIRDYGWKANDEASQSEAQRKFSDYGKGWRPCFTEWLKFLSALDYVRKSKNMEVGLIAHAVVSSFTNPEGDNYNVWKSNLHDSEKTSLWARTKEWADIVLFMNYRIAVKDQQVQAGGAKKGKGVMTKGDRGRLCYSTKTGSCEGKVRAGWSLPETFPLSQEIFRGYLSATPAADEPAAPATENDAPAETEAQYEPEAAMEGVVQ